MSSSREASPPVAARPAAHLAPPATGGGASDDPHAGPPAGAAAAASRGGPTRQARRQRARLIIIGLAAGLAYALFPYAVGLLGIPVLYVITVPAYRRLAPRIGHAAAAWLLVLASLLLLLLPLTWLFTIIIDQGPAILGGISQSPLLARLGELRIGDLDVGGQLRRMGETLLERLSGRALDVFGSATRGVLNLVIALTGLFYMLRSGPEQWASLRQYLPYTAEGIERLRARFYSVTEATVLGTALTAVLQGTIVGVGFAIAGLPNALFWGGVTAFASVVPVVGSALVWLPGVLVLAGSGRWGSALLLAIFGGIVASNIDNIIRPVINKRVSQIHPLTTLLGAFAGLELFGLIGVLLGPLAIAYFFELVRMYAEEYEH